MTHQTDPAPDPTQGNPGESPVPSRLVLRAPRSKADRDAIHGLRRALAQMEHRRKEFNLSLLRLRDALDNVRKRGLELPISQGESERLTEPTGDPPIVGVEPVVEQCNQCGALRQSWQDKADTRCPNNAGTADTAPCGGTLVAP